MWNPTHVQLTVLRARHLISRGKAGNNDVYVTIQLCKQKFQTSTIKNAQNPEWFEECQLEIPSMSDIIELTLYHRGMLQDDFLGYAFINLSDYKVQERPRNQWIALKGKPKKPDSKARGDIEVRLSFVVKSVDDLDQKVKKRPASFKNSSKSNKLNFIRSVSFRDQASPDSGSPVKTVKPTASVLNAKEKGWRNSMPIIPVNNGAGGDTSPSLPAMKVATLHTSHTDLTTSKAPDEIEPMKRSDSIPLPKFTSPHHQRPRIHMGSATLSKSEPPSAEVRNTSLRNIIEEPMARAAPVTPTSVDLSHTPPSFTDSFELNPEYPGYNKDNDFSVSLPTDYIPSNLNTSFNSIDLINHFPRNVKTSNVTVAADEMNNHTSSTNSKGRKQHSPSLNSNNNSADASLDLTNSFLSSSVTDEPSPQIQFTNKDLNKATHSGNVDLSHPVPRRRKAIGVARKDYNEHMNSIFDSRNLHTEQLNSCSDERVTKSGSITDSLDTSRQAHITIQDKSNGSSHSRRSSNNITPPIPPPPLRPFSTSDSDDYTESSSAKSRQKPQLREEEPMRRRSKIYRNPLLSPQHRRYSHHGISGHYERPSLYVYNDMHTCHEEFRRTYFSDDEDPQDLLSVYRNMTKEELIHLCLKNKAQLIRKDQYLHDLEKYIDDLLVRVMETTPRILGLKMARC